MAWEISVSWPGHTNGGLDHRQKEVPPIPRSCMKKSTLLAMTIRDARGNLVLTANQRLVTRRKGKTRLPPEVYEMIYFESCPRCNGDLHADRDPNGSYVSYFQWGWLKDLPQGDTEPESPVALLAILVTLASCISGSNRLQRSLSWLEVHSCRVHWLTSSGPPASPASSASSACFCC